MKTTKKGFTLIELIVVIAIIGVLAAILVPTMLGYVKKSKVSSANSTASSVYKAINSTLTELDEEGVDISGTHVMSWDNTSNVWSGAQTVSSGSDIAANIGTANTTKFEKKVTNFFGDIGKVKFAQAALSGGSCLAVATATDTTYTGTHPGGVVTTDTYSAYKCAAVTDCNHALAMATYVALGGKASDTTFNATVTAKATAEGFSTFTPVVPPTSGSSTAAISV